MIYIGVGGIIALIAVAVLVLAGIVITLYLTVVTDFILKRNVREFNRNFEYLHALLFGQDAQFVKRLEIISRTNLLYVDIHMKFNKRYKEIRDNLDAETQAAVNNAKDLLSEKAFKELKKVVPQVRQIVSNYDKEVSTLNNDLVNVIKPEEDCRQASLTSKEKLRVLKQDYFIKQADLGLIVPSFDSLFASLEKCFIQFEKLVESAQYDEAKSLLEKVDKVIAETTKIFPQLPGICTTITSIIPAKINVMNERYEEMLGQKYPLTHLMVKTAIEDMNRQLDAITERLKSFTLVGINEQLDGILSRIEEFIESFDNEESAKEVFDKECDNIYEGSSQIEKRYIKLCNVLPEIKKIFILSEVQQDNIAIIRDQINKTGATKRSLDTFIHSGNLQPYTVLVSKMRTLEEETENSNRLLDEFFSYLSSLKSDSDAALGKIEVTYKEIKKRETLLLQCDINAEIEKYQEKIESIYKTLDNCYSTLTQTPIDVAKVNILVDEFVGKSYEICGKIDSDLSDKAQAEQAIIYANRDRMHLGDLHQILKQTEDLYYSGEFATALAETTKVLQSIRSGESNQ